MRAHLSKAVPLLLAGCCLSSLSALAETWGLPASFMPAPQEDSKDDCITEMCESQLSDDFLLRYRINMPSDATTLEPCDECTISMEAIYEGEAWVSIAVGTDGSMIGGEAVIGIPGGVPLKYSLSAKSVDGVVQMPDSAQTLTDASVEVIDGRTIMKFTKLMMETDEIEITTGANVFLWAHGSSSTLGYHPGNARSSFDLNLSSGLVAEVSVSVPNMSAWLAHGVMAFIAWGVLVPFAVNSSLFRDLLPKRLPWFDLHRAFNTTAFALFVAYFSVAVSYTTQEGIGHFNNSHQRMGLFMFTSTALQVLGGMFHPKLPVPDSGEEKTIVRKVWEGKHRLFGAALLACGFWEMGEGIRLYSIKYSVNESSKRDVCIAYWVWIGIMTASVILGVWQSKFRKGKPSDPKYVPPAVESADSGVVIPKALADVEVDSDGRE